MLIIMVSIYLILITIVSLFVLQRITNHVSWSIGFITLIPTAMSIGLSTGEPESWAMISKFVCIDHHSISRWVVGTSSSPSPLWLSSHPTPARSFRSCRDSGQLPPFTTTSRRTEMSAPRRRKSRKTRGMLRPGSARNGIIPRRS